MSFLIKFIIKEPDIHVLYILALNICDTLEVGLVL